MKREAKAGAVIAREERQRWVERYRASGLGLRDFAQEHGLDSGQLRYWVYYGVRSPEPAKPVGMFQEVELPAHILSSPGWGVEVGWPGGLTMRLRPGTDPAWVGALAEVLRRPCSSH